MIFTSPKTIILKNLRELLEDIQNQCCNSDEKTVRQLIEEVEKCPKKTSFDSLIRTLNETGGDTYTVIYVREIMKRALGLEVCLRCGEFCRMTCPVKQSPPP